MMIHINTNFVEFEKRHKSFGHFVVSAHQSDESVVHLAVGESGIDRRERDEREVPISDDLSGIDGR